MHGYNAFYMVLFKFSVSSQSHLPLSHNLCSKLSSWNLIRRAKGLALIFLSWQWKHFFGRVSKVSDVLFVGPIKEALHPRKSEVMRHPQLINMNHNMCPYSCINAMLAHILDKCFLKDHIHTISRWSRLPFFVAIIWHNIFI